MFSQDKLLPRALDGLERHYVLVKEFRIERPLEQVFRPRQTIEPRASSDWLAFRAPLVTLVTCRRQVSSIYRMVNKRTRTQSDKD